MTNAIGVVDRERGDRTCLPTRYLMAIVGSLSVAIIYMYKLNASLAMMTMVNHTAVARDRTAFTTNATYHEFGKSGLTCEYEREFVQQTNTTRKALDGPFVWDEKVQSLILSAQFWGSLILQIPLGRLAELFSPKWMIFGSVTINMLASILTPLFARIHYAGFVTIRIVQGLGIAMIHPALHVLISRWSMPNERSTFSSIIYTGMMYGVVFSALVTGLLADNVRWDMIFYIEGVIPIIWCLVAWLFVQDSPEQDKRFASRRERDSIARSLGNADKKSSVKKPPVPWWSILRSRPVWAIVISHASFDFTWVMVTTQLSSYLFHIMRLSMRQISLMMSICYTGIWIFALVLSRILTICVARGKITICTSRKIAMGISTIVPACCFLVIAFAQCNRVVVIVSLFIALPCHGGAFSGFIVNHVDIAPNFAGTLFGITRTSAAVSGLVVPLVVGALTHRNQTLDAWRRVMYVVVAVNVIDCTNYVAFSSAEVQSWNDTKKNEEEQTEEEIPLKT